MLNYEDFNAGDLVRFRCITAPIGFNKTKYFIGVVISKKTLEWKYSAKSYYIKIFCNEGTRDLNISQIGWYDVKKIEELK